MHDGVVVIDDQDLIHWCNDSLLRIFACGRDHLIGMPLDVLIPTKRRHGHAQRLASFRNSNETSRPMMDRTNTIEGVRFDGSVVPLGISVAKVTDHSRMFCIAVVRDLSASVQYQEALKLQADHDYLTGLLNRRAFTERLADYRKRQPCGVLTIMDIDNFKQINDQHGHLIGDEVLVAMSRRLAEGVREDALIGRWGGEEFISFHPGATEQEVAAALEGLCQTVRSAPLAVGATLINLTISAGVSRITGMETFNEALARADQSLYHAKNTGRDRVVIAEQNCALSDKGDPR